MLISSTALERKIEKSEKILEAFFYLKEPPCTRLCAKVDNIAFKFFKINDVLFRGISG